MSDAKVLIDNILDAIKTLNDLDSLREKEVKELRERVEKLERKPPRFLRWLWRNTA